MVLRFICYFLFPSCILVLRCYGATVVADKEMTYTEFKGHLQSRCVDYQNTINRIYPGINCNTASTSFLNIFKTWRAACYMSSYNQFIRNMQHPIPKDKGLLWSGVPCAVERISDKGRVYMPISFTLTGYMLYGFEICGKVMNNSAGCFNCPSKNATRAFWEMASQYYAQNIKGKVLILLSARKRNGKESTFFERSIFAKTEIPNLSKEVTSLMVRPIQENKTDPVRNVCNQPSMIELKTILTGKHHIRSYKCEEMERLMRPHGYAAVSFSPVALGLTKASADFDDPQFCPRRAPGGGAKQNSSVWSMVWFLVLLSFALQN